MDSAHFSGIRVWALLAVFAAPLCLTNCSSSGGAAAATGGSSGSEGGSNSQGGSTANGGQGNTSTVFSLLSQSVGRFFVKLNPADTILGTPANTGVDGVVKDGSDPNAYAETAQSTENGCTLYRLTAPSCANANSGAGCNVATEVCTGTDACTRLPTKKNVGTVTVTGIETTTGTGSFAMTSVSNSYSVGGDVTLVYPGFAEGGAIKVSASGGDYAAFDISAKGIAQLVLGATSYTVSSSGALAVTWTPAGSASDARIQATLNLSHHGGSKGYIACDVEDSGSLTISKAQIAGLIDMGVAGYPTLTVIRRSTGIASVSAGQVVLSVESSVSPALTVEGFVSCTTDTDCQTGTCNTDLKLCE